MFVRSLAVLSLGLALAPVFCGAEEVNMSFLYRDKSDGPTQSYANITVEDAKPVTVIATGVAGDVTREKIDAAFKVLHESLAESKKWQVAGDPRVLGYNGPDIKESLRWGEVQLPVERVEE